jgi:hypothetical protein
MQVKDLKEICQLMSACGLVDEFHMKKNGHIVGTDAGKTFLVDLQYNMELPEDISITNLKGVQEMLNTFKDDAKINIVDNRIVITDLNDNDENGKIVLTTIDIPNFKIPELTNSDFEIIVDEVDHNILNSISKSRPQTLINELYYLFVENGKLKLRIGEADGDQRNKRIGITNSTTTNVAKFTMNLSECFKNITTNTSIKIITSKFMLVEAKGVNADNTEKYNIKYYLAPRVE